MKNITDYLNKQEIQNVKRRFNHLANYKYGDTTDVNECEESLFLVLDADDEINTVFNEEKRYILEYEIYKKFPPTKCVYRLDRSNNTTGQQTHIHVYADKKRHHQLYAINIDGSSHDGSKYLLSPKHQDALRVIGFIVPKDGLLEWCDLGACRLILG
ncbi:MAG: hypothetical protein E7093_05745 [Bacteroidales bacterium]|nr:hypothetical protein [Bacteroidales bacterium]